MLASYMENCSWTFTCLKDMSYMRYIGVISINTLMLLVNIFDITSSTKKGNIERDMTRFWVTWWYLVRPMFGQFWHVWGLAYFYKWRVAAFDYFYLQKDKIKYNCQLMISWRWRHMGVNHHPQDHVEGYVLGMQVTTVEDRYIFTSI